MKKILGFLLAFFLLFSLSACSDVLYQTYETKEQPTFTATESQVAEESFGADDVSDEALKRAERTVTEDESYIRPAQIAAYIHRYGKLPPNFVTKNEAKQNGWNSQKGNLAEVLPGKSIGGDRFGNYEGRLPKGKKYRECDTNYQAGTRGACRIVFSNDGEIYYSDDHYETFKRLY